MGKNEAPPKKQKPQHREPEPSFGPDEEGEVPLEPDQIPSKDRRAWVRERRG